MMKVGDKVIVIKNIYDEFTGTKIVNLGFETVITNIISGWYFLKGSISLSDREIALVNSDKAKKALLKNATNEIEKEELIIKEAQAAIKYYNTVLKGIKS